MRSDSPSDQHVARPVSGIVDRLLRAFRFRRQPIVVAPDSPSPIAFCPFCGAVLDIHFKSANFCPSCGKQIRQAAETPPLGDTPNPSKESQEALAQAILRYTLGGWYVVRHKSDLAELRKPKRFSWTLAWATFAAGFPLPGWAIIFPAVYAMWHMAKKEKTLLLYIDGNGNVQELTPPNQI